jgi:hypothetical protein
VNTKQRTTNTKQQTPNTKQQTTNNEQQTPNTKQQTTLALSLPKGAQPIKKTKDKPLYN